MSEHARHDEIVSKLNSANEKLSAMIEIVSAERREIHLMRKEMRELFAGNPDAIAALAARLKTSQEALTAASVGAENPGPVPPLEMDGK